jgi:hypothetical protein
MILPSLGSITSPVAGTPAGISAPVPSSCTYTAASQSFACPTVTLSGLTISHSFTLLDASGKPQTQFDANTTAAVRLKSSVVGTVSESGNTLNVDQQQELTISGLLTGSHVLNGLSVVKSSGNVMSGSTSQYVSFTTTATIVNLVPPKDASVNPWPASGTILTDFSTSSGPGGAPGLVMRIGMTFNGTSKVAVEITYDGFTSRCTLDLSSTAPACV